MRTRIFAVIAVALVGCAPVIQEDFDGYIAQPKGCDLVAPQTSNPREYKQCASSESCVAANAAGEPSYEETTCFASKGIADLGACTYANDCAPGSFCAPLGCLRYCRVGEEGTCGGEACLPFDDGLMLHGARMGYCAPPACDPVASNCEGACIFHEPTRASCFAQTGTKPRGSACKWDHECGRGLACGAEHVCTPHCRIGKDDCGGKRCLQIEGESLSIDGVAYGYCASR